MIIMKIVTHLHLFIWYISKIELTIIPIATIIPVLEEDRMMALNITTIQTADKNLHPIYFSLTYSAKGSPAQRQAINPAGYQNVP